MTCGFSNLASQLPPLLAYFIDYENTFFTLDNSVSGSCVLLETFLCPLLYSNSKAKKVLIRNLFVFLCQRETSKLEKRRSSLLQFKVFNIWY